MGCYIIYIDTDFRGDNMIKAYIGNRRCALLGLGVSHLPLARLLCDICVPLIIYDKNDASYFGDSAKALQAAGARFVRADADFSGIEGDIIFRSPGIRPDKSGIVAAVESGACLTSEVELFLHLTSAKTYGITGSDGKTTTTTLTGKFLDADGKRTFVGGNIGRPLLTLAPNMSERDCAVLELSSFQLMHLCDTPEYVAITNISENHLDWHTDMSEYIAAKKNIIGRRTKRLVTNAECPEAVEIARQTRDKEIVLFSSKKHAYEDFSGLVEGEYTAIFVRDGYISSADKHGTQELLSLSKINLPGTHNIENFMTAIGLTLGNVSIAAYSRVAEGFFGVEHRLERVRCKDGVEFYNSSIDSSPTRTCAALSAMSGRSLVLICGGYDKNLDYSPLADAICRHGGIHTLVLTGATAGKIAAEMSKLSHGVHIIKESDFDAAVALAADAARAGDAVLLSPASASFDAFKNFSERGAHFKDLINRL